MPSEHPKKPAPLPPAAPAKGLKKVSVMAWIEDPFGQVLFVRQTKGQGRWTLPGGKVKTGEPLVNALRREVREEIGAEVATAAPVDIFDRPQAGSVTILFRVLLKPGEFTARPGEIEEIAMLRRLPARATPAAVYFHRQAQLSFEPLSLFAYEARKRGR